MNTVKITYPIIVEEQTTERGHIFIGTSPNLEGFSCIGTTLEAAKVDAAEVIPILLQDKEYPEPEEPVDWELKENQKIAYVDVDLPTDKEEYWYVVLQYYPDYELTQEKGTHFNVGVIVGSKYNPDEEIRCMFVNGKNPRLKALLGGKKAVEQYQTKVSGISLAFPYINMKEFSKNGSVPVTCFSPVGIVPLEMEYGVGTDLDAVAEELLDFYAHTKNAKASNKTMVKFKHVTKEKESTDE